MLELEDLRFSRPGFTLALDLSLPDRAYGIVLGPSGSGKSTVLRLISGLLEPESGKIRLQGRELSGVPPEKRGIGMVFQDYALFPTMSVRRNIEYGPRIRVGVWDRKGRAELRRAATELARGLRIEGLLERQPESLSGGERQRVALARSLAAKPELLLLDEPLSSLDPSLRRELRTELGLRVREAGLSALHVTHDLDEALALGDIIFLMHKGGIVESGSPEALYERPKTAFAAAFFGRGPLIPLVEVGEGREWIRTALGPFRLSGLETQRYREDGLRRHRGLDGSVRPYLFFPSSRALLLGSCPNTDSEKENVFAGILVESIYHGASRELRLELGSLQTGGASFEARLSVSPDLRPQVGEILSFRVPPDAARIVWG